MHFDLILHHANKYQLSLISLLEIQVSFLQNILCFIVLITKILPYLLPLRTFESTEPATACRWLQPILPQSITLLRFLTQPMMPTCGSTCLPWSTIHHLTISSQHVESHQWCVLYFLNHPIS